MNILITPDVDDWAIGNLTKAIIKNNKRFNFYKVCVHPRGVPQGIAEIQKLIREGVKFDLWHAQYWNSARQLLQMMPEFKEIPILLTHHNHHCLEEENWQELGFDMLNEMTDWGVNVLKKKHPNVIKIPHGIDLDKYSFLKEYPPKEDRNVGYVGRVCPWKHLKEIAEASNELGYKTIGCGYIDKPEYWESVPKDNLEFNGGFGRGSMAAENFEVEIYRNMSVFVMYSTDEKESGTLPLLEAMARGVPVLATEQGMARDLIKDGENGVFFNESNFKEKLKMVMEDLKLRKNLREKAWQTIKNYSESKMARDYGKAYYKLAFSDKRLVSVIIPTFNRAKELMDILLSIEAQNYPAKEIIVCDDGSTDETPIVVEEAKKKFKTPILYQKTGEKLEYGLAKARNAGAIEAMGDVLLFLDDRYTLEPGALEKVAQTAMPKTFGYGVKIIRGKESTKKSFIENFAWILKKDFVDAGMFNEQMTLYGGLSQETRERFNHQGFTTMQVNDVKCKEIIHTSRTKKKDEIWKSKLKLQKMYER